MSSSKAKQEFVSRLFGKTYLQANDDDDRFDVSKAFGMTKLLQAVVVVVGFVDNELAFVCFNLV